MENQLAERQVSTNLGLSTALLELRAGFEKAARQNLAATVTDPGFTDMEKLSILKWEQVKLIGGMDLAAVQLRGQLLKEIELDGLFSVHPNHYDSMEDAALQAGLSVTQYSNIRTMVDIVFPYMENVLGVNIAQWWEEIGKTNFTTVLPILRALATGQPPDRGSTLDNYEAVLNDTMASALASPDPEERHPDEETLRARAFDNLLNTASHVRTTRELQRHINQGRHTPGINATIINNQGTRIFIAEMSDDQYLALQRKLGPFLDEQTFNLPADPQESHLMASQIPYVRNIARLIVEED
jgi:hypothetical protein